MNSLTKLIEFLARLETAKLHYELGHFRDSIAVLVAAPGARWEVEFFEDGHVEVEVFRSNGVEADADGAVERLFDEQAN